MEIAIIGAGMTGLTIARRLHAAGHAPVVFEKSRGVGGRLATRRAEGGLQFDHGAQYVAASAPGFADLLGKATAAGAAAEWPEQSDASVFVGSPGMSGIAKFIATGLDIRLGAEISAVTPGPNGWELRTATGTEHAKRLVLAIPTFQAVTLLPNDSPLAVPINRARMQPCLTLMMAIEQTRDEPFAVSLEAREPIEWLARDSDKPGRSASGVSCWVAHANPRWSHRYLNATKDQIMGLMAPMVCDMLDADPADVAHLDAHKWRYATTARPLGQPFLTDRDDTLYVGGDWCLGDRVEDAWKSGMAIADALIGA